MLLQTIAISVIELAITFLHLLYSALTGLRLQDYVDHSVGTFTFTHLDLAYAAMCLRQSTVVF
ncbi:MAG: hypothetical protein ACU4EQ_01900 [Candidatus Nitrosoglobus sp.]